MATTTAQNHNSLNNLPLELLDHIAYYLPTASSISNLSRTSKNLHVFVENDGWKTFSRTKFPSIFPADTSSYQETARTLTTLSKAWDKRAFVARYVEPRGDITAYPGSKKVEKWKRPKGQTIGFTPRLDAYEEMGSTWRERRETLAFTAGAEVCIRQTNNENITWMTYRPLSASEGKDDITTMHLLRPTHDDEQQKVKIITGTANGDLQLLHLPGEKAKSKDVDISYFATQGRTVRSSSLLDESCHQRLLVASLGDSLMAVYNVDATQSKICPSSQVEVKPSLRDDGNPSPAHRVWSTNFLSDTALAVGVGPSDSPVHIYSISESGISQAPLRRLSLQEDHEKKHLSSIYTCVSLPPSLGSSGNGDIFLSGAYDGIVRLHDLRSDRSFEQTYRDPVDDSPIYSILPRGQEKFLAGTSRHNLLKVFDMRLGAKKYDYRSCSSFGSAKYDDKPAKDFNIFLRANNNAFTSRGGNWSQGRSRSAESSVYSLAAPSMHSPYIYAGVESAIWSLAFTEILDPHPDPAFFSPWSTNSESRSGKNADPRYFNSKEVLGLAKYEQDANMKLSVQKSLWDTWSAFGSRRKAQESELDERWKVANEFGPH